IERSMSHAANHADDRQLMFAVNRELPAERISARPVPVRRGPADDDDERPILAIILTESPAAEKADPESPEVVGRDNPVISAGRGREHPPVDGESARAVAARQWEPAGQTHS